MTLICPMSLDEDKENLHLNSSFDPYVKPRGLFILVPQNLVALDMPSNPPKF
jgi:hypothetical protein